VEDEASLGTYNGEEPGHGGGYKTTKAAQKPLLLFIEGLF
jgi:hypothetical protein